MSIKNFSVGPSALYEGIEEDIQELLESKILETSHRSPEFSAMSKKTIEAVRRYLEVPEDYYVFYTASASEAMEITLRSGVEKMSSHITKGAFGEKWEKMARKLGYDTQLLQAEYGSRFEIEEIEIDSDAEAIFVTANETSTGCMYRPEEMVELREKYPKKLLCVDATSCAGAVHYDIAQTDVFLFSVQKCFGVPSGLGVLICSPRFFEKCQNKKGDIGVVHNLPDMWKKMEGKYQTAETPPIFQIALLGRAIERIEAKMGNLKSVCQAQQEKTRRVWEFFDRHAELNSFIENPLHRSSTIVVVHCGDEDNLCAIKKNCTEEGITLAGGYGQTKKKCFRIASFLAHSNDDHQGIFEKLE